MEREVLLEFGAWEFKDLGGFKPPLSHSVGNFPLSLSVRRLFLAKDDSIKKTKWGFGKDDNTKKIKRERTTDRRDEK